MTLPNLQMITVLPAPADLWYTDEKTGRHIRAAYLTVELCEYDARSNNDPEDFFTIVRAYDPTGFILETDIPDQCSGPNNGWYCEGHEKDPATQ